MPVLCPSQVRSSHQNQQAINAPRLASPKPLRFQAKYRHGQRPFSPGALWSMPRHMPRAVEYGVSASWEGLVDHCSSRSPYSEISASLRRRTASRSRRRECTVLIGNRPRREEHLLTSPKLPLLRVRVHIRILSDSSAHLSV